MVSGPVMNKACSLRRLVSSSFRDSRLSLPVSAACHLSEQAGQQVLLRSCPSSACETHVSSPLQVERLLKQSGDANSCTDAGDAPNPSVTGSNFGRRSPTRIGWTSRQLLPCERPGFALPWGCGPGPTRPLHTRTAGSPQQQRTGLFGYEELTSPQGFRAMGEDARARSEALMAEAKREDSPLRVITLLDDVSNELCRVMDACELCRNTHPDRAYVEAAQETFLNLSEYVQSLNSSLSLYSILVRAEAGLAVAPFSSSATPDKQHPSSAPSGTHRDSPSSQSRGRTGSEPLRGTEHPVVREARQVAKLLRQDFERGGVHLLPAAKAEVERLHHHSTILGMQFCRNIDLDPSAIEISPASLLDSLPPNAKAQLLRAPPGRRRGTGPSAGPPRSSRSAWVPAVPPSVSAAVLKWVPNEEVRREVFLLASSSPVNNADVLQDLITTRHSLAQHLGYPSYAHFVTAPLLAGSPDTVLCFLQDLSSSIQAKAHQEQQLLLAYKREHEGVYGAPGADASKPRRSAGRHSMGSRKGKGGRIAAWDHSFYTGMAKAREHRLDSRVVAGYFPLSACVQGMCLVVESLFGMHMRPVEAHPGETWAPDVAKYALFSSSGRAERVVGEVYLDLHPRAGKFGHAAHFTLRCGRWPDEATEGRDAWRQPLVTSAALPRPQTPAVALVCNFPSAAPGGGTCLLNHSDVETLFHEFGHALHSLLSRTAFQHASGTRAALDFVEIPSHLMEHMVWDPRVLSQFAHHHASGEPIPPQMVAALREARAMFSATDLQAQLLYALVDQRLFGEAAGTPGGVSEAVAELQEEHGPVGHVPGTHWHCRFSHFVGYGAGYYSYVYAKNFAAHLWAEYLERDPLAQEAGAALRERLLGFGGAQDPSSVLEAAIGLARGPAQGVQPDPSFLFRDMGM